MSDEHDPAMSRTHPDELLAGFVEGTATPDERREVEAHLSTCPACRQEVALAEVALDALRSLPELDSPWAGAEAASAPGAPARPVADDLEERRARRRRVGIGLVAAAAVLVAAFIYLGPFRHATSSGAASTAAPEKAASAPLRTVSAQDIDALALQLAAGEDTGALSPGGSSVDTGASAAPLPSRNAPSAPGPQKDAGPSLAAIPPGGLAAAVNHCYRQAAGVPAGARIFGLTSVLFEGRPAAIVAFDVSGTADLMPTVIVAVVSQDGCQLLHLARAVQQPVP